VTLPTQRCGWDVIHGDTLARPAKAAERRHRKPRRFHPASALGSPSAERPLQQLANGTTEQRFKNEPVYSVRRWLHHLETVPT
jgi:hypothetical protein